MKVTKNSRSCMFCKNSTVNEPDFGPLKMTKTFQAHYYCLLFSETIKQSGKDHQGIYGFLPSDISEELVRSKQKQCFYCKERGATLGCVNKFCNRKFHLPCGLKKNIQQNFNNFTTYCHAHRKPSNIPVRIKKSINEYKCVICLENFSKIADIMTNIIWADCCKADIVLHLCCMKKLALSAGYFTKCPGCNNISEFLKTIKFWGVFVPERDASWELSRNAYSELYQVHNTCDVKKCRCFHGRNYATERGKWKLFLCNLCGSFGTHQGCSKVKSVFICDTCNLNERSVTSSSSQTTHTNTLKETDRQHQTPLQSSSSVSSRLDECPSIISQSTESQHHPIWRRITRSSKFRESCNIRRNENVENKDDYKNTPKPKNKTINLLESDEIVIDVDSNSDDDTCASKKPSIISQYIAVLDDITKTVAFTEGENLNRPSTSKSKTEFLGRNTRKVAIKSTTKLPYSNRNLVSSAQHNEKTVDLVDDVIVIDAYSDEDENYSKKQSSVLVKETAVFHESASATNENSSGLKRQSLLIGLTLESPSSQIDRKVAVKSTTKLPYLNKNPKNVTNHKEQIIKLHDDDDDDDIIIIDSYSDEETNDLHKSENTVTHDKIVDATINLPSTSKVEPVSPCSKTDRKVALKSTTKLPSLKRKISDSENSSSEQPFQCEKQCNELPAFAKLCNNSEISRITKPPQKFRRVARMRTTPNLPFRFNKLVISKVNSMIKKHGFVKQEGSLPLNCSIRNNSVDIVEHTSTNTDPLSFEEHLLHYNVPLNVDGEIEFVNNPNVTVTAQGKACPEQ